MTGAQASPAQTWALTDTTYTRSSNDRRPDRQGFNLDQEFGPRETAHDHPGRGWRRQHIRKKGIARRQRVARFERFGKWLLPVAVMIAMIWFWDRLVVCNEIPHFILPRPGLVLETLIKDWPMLFDALLVTLQITMMALAVAVIGGVGLAVLFTQSRLVEMSFYPYRAIRAMCLNMAGTTRPCAR